MSTQLKATPGPWRRAGMIGGQVLIKSESGEYVASVANSADSHIVEAAPKLYSEVSRDLAYAREIKSLLEASRLTGTIQYQQTLMRIEANAAALAQARGDL